MKIKELNVNEVYTLPLVVMAANARETKAKKPYLQMELSDGIDTISGNYWDWSSGVIPKNNTILDVSAQVTEWQGNKQLNIRSLRNNTEKHISDFMPTSNHNVADIYKEAYNLVGSIEDEFLSRLGLDLLEEPTLQSLWLQAPGANTIHHAYVAGTLIHSLSVARLAQAMASEIPEANKALVTFGAMFHDIGKLYGYQLNGMVCEMTEEGMLFEHLFMGAQLVDNYAESHGFVRSPRDELKLQLVKHIILSHHGKREYGAAVPPMCIEAHIVHLADDLDSRSEQIKAASNKLGNVKFTDKLWALENRPHLTTQYIEGIFRAE